MQNCLAPCSLYKGKLKCVLFVGLRFWRLDQNLLWWGAWPNVRVHERRLKLPCPIEDQKLRFSTWTSWRYSRVMQNHFLYRCTRHIVMPHGHFSAARVQLVVVLMAVATRVPGLLAPPSARWPWDWRHRSTARAGRQVGPAADPEGWRWGQRRCSCECPRPSRKPRPRSATSPPQPDWSRSRWRPPGLWRQIPLAKWDPSHVAEQDLQHRHSHAFWSLECHIVRDDSSQKPQPRHRFEETRYEIHLHRPGCTTCFHREVECCIVHIDCVPQQRHSRHSGAGQYEHSRLTPGCMTCRSLGLECCTGRVHYFRKLRRNHHFGEEPYESCLQKLGWTWFLQPKEGCHIVRQIFPRKVQPCHHFEEVLYATPQQQPGYRKIHHPKLEYRIVHDDCFHKLLPSRHFGEEPCELSLHQRVCMEWLSYIKVKTHIVHENCCRKSLHCHQIGEGLYDIHLQKPECISFLSPEEDPEYCIVRRYYSRRPQHGHHFGEALCDTCLQKFFQQNCLTKFAPKTPQRLLDQKTLIAGDGSAIVTVRGLSTAQPLIRV